MRGTVLFSPINWIHDANFCIFFNFRDSVFVIEHDYSFDFN
jgi:hypothetical protein